MPTKQAQINQFTIILILIVNLFKFYNRVDSYEMSTSDEIISKLYENNYQNMEFL